MLDKRLELNDEQRAAWDNLCDALGRCEELSMGFAYDWHYNLYAWNNKEVKDVFFPEDSHKDYKFVKRDELWSRQFDVLELCDEDKGFNVEFKG